MRLPIAAAVLLLSAQTIVAAPVDRPAKWPRRSAPSFSIRGVVTMEKGDLMPSYFLAETLKYLYLLFAPESVHRGASVQKAFTTEAQRTQRNKG